MDALSIARATLVEFQSISKLRNRIADSCVVHRAELSCHGGALKQQARSLLQRLNAKSRDLSCKASKEERSWLEALEQDERTALAAPRHSAASDEPPRKVTSPDGLSEGKELLLNSLLLAVAGGMVAGLNLEGPGSVVEALSVLGLIIAVHECGHFLAARLQGIHVSKFSIGFGPTLAKYQGSNVEYALRAIPLGGFVGFPDDDPDSAFAQDDPDLLRNRPIFDRVLVISAGVIANIIFAYTVLFAQASTVGLLQQQFYPGVTVPDVFERSAGERGGLKPGDLILSIDGRPVPAGQSSVAQVVEEIRVNGGNRIAVQVERRAPDSPSIKERVTLDLVPDKQLDGSGRMGVQLTPNMSPIRVRSDNLLGAAGLAGKEFGRLLSTVLDGLSQIVFNFGQTADRVSGPVAIVAVGAEVARTDATGLAQFAAIVNLNLAVLNMLPLPALDGGYLAILLVEALRGGKKIPTEVEQGIMSSGLLMMMGLGLFLMVRDTVNLGFL